MRSTSSRPGFLRSRALQGVTSLLLAVGLSAGGVLTAAPASADEIGQAPTPANIIGNGSFGVASTGIGNPSGFGGGQAYYPTTPGTYPVIAVVPGYLSYWSSMSWIGPRLASWGYVVVGIETNTIYDQPASRGSQLRSALNWAVNSSPSAVRSRVDANRQGVAGWSMGGGGSLEALKADTSGRIKAAVPIAPWNGDKSWPEVSEPVAIVGGQSDSVAPVGSHSIPFYNSLPGQKAYVELSGADHFFVNRDNAHLSWMLVSWFKRYLNNDARFTSYTCGFDDAGVRGVSSFRTNAC
ncbi:alpha/beta hydrolase family protein [Streptomyces sp. NPDC056337]|uniref:alpha/beta hydrolase family protein n=1 Tax=Streptomyces sp. NPDC056337 TaxID=3345787 RepID=UPI0035D6A02A